MGSSVKRANIEALLRIRKLDRTLVVSDDPLPDMLAAVGIADLDRQLHGGFPRGQLSELIGVRSAGRTTVLHALLASATSRGELVALMDSLDTFDPQSAAAAGVDLDRLLWIRGPSITACSGSLMQLACERAVKAFNLILQAGGYGVMVLDLADMPLTVLRQLPLITWFRLQRGIEGRDGAGLLIADVHLARSARGLTLELAPTIAPDRFPVQRSPWQLPPFAIAAERCQRSVAS